MTQLVEHGLNCSAAARSAVALDSPHCLPSGSTTHQLVHLFYDHVVGLVTTNESLGNDAELMGLVSSVEGYDNGMQTRTNVCIDNV